MPYLTVFRTGGKLTARFHAVADQDAAAAEVFREFPKASQLIFCAELESEWIPFCWQWTNAADAFPDVFIKTECSAVADVRKGVDISDACTAAASHSRISGNLFLFQFNGIDIVSKPGSHRLDLEEIYRLKSKLQRVEKS